MPRGNGTGPLGIGPLTGRGAGFCAGFKTPGYDNTGVGRTMWLGRGRRYRRMFWFTGLLPGCVYLSYRLLNRNRYKNIKF